MNHNGDIDSKDYISTTDKTIGEASTAKQCKCKPQVSNTVIGHDGAKEL
jgi:hypothetical protein